MPILEDPRVIPLAIQPAPAPTGAPSAVPAPTAPVADMAGPMPADVIGDIPPPPIPALPTSLLPPSSELGGGLRERPKVPGSMRGTRFGPGVPVVGGGSTDVAGLGTQPPRLTDEDLARLIASLAGRYSGGAA